MNDFGAKWWLLSPAGAVIKVERRAQPARQLLIATITGAAQLVA